MPVEPSPHEPIHQPTLLGGFWIWDVRRDQVAGFFGDAGYFGFTASEVAVGLPLDAYLRRVAEGDRNRVRVALERSLRAGDEYCESYRVETLFLGTRAIRAMGRCQFDQAGRPTFFPGWFVDITDAAHESDALGSMAHHVHQAQKIAQLLDRDLISYLLDNVLEEVQDVRHEIHARGGAASKN